MTSMAQSVGEFFLHSHNSFWQYAAWICTRFLRHWLVHVSPFDILLHKAIESGLQHSVALVITSGLSWTDLFYRFYVGRRPSIMIVDLEMLKLILVKEFDAFTDRPVTYHKYFPSGLSMKVSLPSLSRFLTSSAKSLVPLGGFCPHGGRLGNDRDR